MFSVCMHYCPQHGSPSSPVKLSTTAYPPGPPRNVTFHFYLDFETNKFRGNATWIGPEFPEGKLIEYRYVLSSVIASTILGGTLSVEVCACVIWSQHRLILKCCMIISLGLCFLLGLGGSRDKLYINYTTSSHSVKGAKISPHNVPHDVSVTHY